MDFSNWLADARRDAASNNAPQPPWLNSDEAARRIFDAMAAGQAKSAERSELASLRAQNADLTRRLTEVERWIGVPGARNSPLIKALGDALGEMHGELHAEITQETDQKLAELERSRIKYCGIHEIGMTYAEGSFCTRSGSLWYALRTTKEQPGNSADWQLAVKRGENRSVAA
jgi:hypothetical protein